MAFEIVMLLGFLPRVHLRKDVGSLFFDLIYVVRRLFMNTAKMSLIIVLPRESLVGSTASRFTAEIKYRPVVHARLVAIGIILRLKWLAAVIANKSIHGIRHVRSI